LLRYLRQVTGRVEVLGSREPHRARSAKPSGDEQLPFEGKVAGICFDRFGDFDGFVLDTEDGLRDFFSREPEVATLVSRAWRQRIAILVRAERHLQH
jgi:hypothetical protein